MTQLQKPDSVVNLGTDNEPLVKNTPEHLWAKKQFTISDKVGDSRSRPANKNSIEGKESKQTAPYVSGFDSCKSSIEEVDKGKVPSSREFPDYQDQP